MNTDKNSLLNHLCKSVPHLWLIFLLITCSFARGQFVVHPDKPISPPLVGFGAEMNPYFYCKPNWPKDINEQNVGDYERKVLDLAPQHLRIFCLNRWFFPMATTEPVAGDETTVKPSLIRSIQLAQRAGATVNLTLWYGPFSLRYSKAPAAPELLQAQAHQFAQVLHELIFDDHLTAIRYVTIQNEVNGEGDDGRHFKLAPDEYETMNRDLDAELRKLNLRDKIKIVGGDLLMREQELWVPYLGHHLSDICDGWSMHAYWDFWDDGKIERRLNGFADLVRALPKNEQKPMFAMEFGVRGRKVNFKENDPGNADNGQPIAMTPLYGNQMARFIIQSLRLGFVADNAWNMDDSLYDHPMKYGLIGTPKDGWPLKPAYHVVRLFTHTTRAGWRGVQVSGSSDDVIVTALVGPKGEVSVYALNIGKESRHATISGIGRRAMQRITWNETGDGKLATPQGVAPGDVRVKLAPFEMIVLTSVEAHL